MSKQVKIEVVFNVRMQVPRGANLLQTQQFIRSAIQSYGGGLDPEDPFFDITADDFTVAYMKKIEVTTYE